MKGVSRFRSTVGGFHPTLTGLHRDFGFVICRYLPVLSTVGARRNQEKSLFLRYGNYYYSIYVIITKYRINCAGSTVAQVRPTGTSDIFLYKFTTYMEFVWGEVSVNVPIFFDYITSFDCIKTHSRDTQSSHSIRY